MNELQQKKHNDIDPFLKFLVHSSLYGNEKAMEIYKKEIAIKNLPIIDKKLREPTEFKETTKINYGGYPIINYFYNNPIEIQINESTFTTNHIRIVQVGFNLELPEYKLKIIKNLKKRENIPFNLEDIETISIKSVSQTTLGSLIEWLMSFQN